MVRRTVSAVMAVLAVSVLAQQTANGPLPTLRTGTKLVVVDVTVTDGNHHAVHGLKAQDFTLLENNTSQVLKNFEEHKPLPPESRPAMPALKPGEFTNRMAAADVPGGPVNVLLIDRLNTPMDSQTRLRAQLLDYLKKTKPGTRTAIFGLNTQLVLLQGFTSDPRLLLQVLTEKKSNPRASAMLSVGEGSGGVDKSPSSALQAQAAYMSSSNPAMAASVAMLAGNAELFEAQILAQQDLDRGRRTLDAMNALARYLSSIPGRKNLVWFSGSFPLEITPDAQLGADVPGASFMTVGDMHEQYRETLSLLSRAQVVMYPIDARGANVLPEQNVAGEGGGGEKYLQPGANGTSRMTNDLNKSLEKTFEENSTMRDLAYATGGRAFLNHNDLAEALGAALDDGSSYYSLSYTPSDGNWRGDYRKLQVKLRQQGYELSYRRGYYADDNVTPAAATKRGGMTKLEVPSYGSMHFALMHAGPEPTDVLLNVQATPTGGPVEDAAAPGNVMRTGLKGPFRRFVVQVKADVSTLQFADAADGQHRLSAEIVTFVYDVDGNLVNGMGQTVAADLKPAVYDALLKNGMPAVKQEISVPEKGEFFLRVVMHDMNDDHVGAVEFPMSVVRGLAPAAVAAPAVSVAAPAGSADPAAGTTVVPLAASAPAAAATNRVATVVAPPVAAPARVPVETMPVLSPAMEAELNAVLARVRQNYEAYVGSVPNLYATEHVSATALAHDISGINPGTKSTAESVFRLQRTAASSATAGRTSPMMETREMKTLNSKAVPEGSHMVSPVVVYGVFTYATSFLSPQTRPCYDYRIDTNEKLHGATATMIEYTLRSPLPAGVRCPFTEQNSGRVYVDPSTMQVLRLEQKRPQHVEGMGVGAAQQGESTSNQTGTGGMTGNLARPAVSPEDTMRAALPPGTRTNWTWSVDYAPVILDSKTFWLPAMVSSTTATTTGRAVEWTFDAKYTDYHLLEVKTTVRGVNGEVVQP